MELGSAQWVIVGAGMAGVAAAFHLARRGAEGIVLVDAGEPLGLTSSQGTEAYRTWWPGFDDAMIRLTSRSVDLLETCWEESGGAFEMSRRGYVFLTADGERLAAMERAAREVSNLGAGPLRRLDGGDYRPSPATGWRSSAEDGSPGDGADLVTEGAAVRRAYPFVSPDVEGLLHVRRAGWLDSRALGRWLLEKAVAAGVRVLRDRVVAIEHGGGEGVRAVELERAGRLATAAVVLAPGPLLPQAAALLGLELPVINELHGKGELDDPLGLVPRDAPLMIWNDPVTLDWSAAETSRLAARPDLLGELPAGVHFRPRGGDENPHLLLLWTYDLAAETPRWPPTFDEHYGEVLVRGLARMVPALEAYFGAGAAMAISGGYYCKAPDNRPLIGPLGVPGAWVCGALSGFGIMASQGAGELLAAHCLGDSLPTWVAAFDPRRFDDPDYRGRLAAWDPRQGEL